MIDTKDLPPELVEELGGVVKEDRKYTAHDHVLACINARDGTSANSLLVYLYVVMDKVTSRGYLYHILSRLRKAGLIETRNSQHPGAALHYTTELGTQTARPYWEVGDND